MGHVQKIGDWQMARHILEAGPVKLRDAVNRAVLQEAQLYRKEIIQGITSGSPGEKSFAPLSETTRAMRKFLGMGGSKPLIARGDLRRSISVVQESFGSVFVGILRSAKGKEGQNLTNVAEVHEFGKTVVVRLTEKAKRFLAMVFRRAGLESTAKGKGSSVLVVRIPARPFLQPVFDKLSKNAVERITRRLGSLLAGDFGGG